MKRILTIVLCFLLSLSLWGQNSELLKSAQNLFAAGDYSSAVTKYQECVKKLSGKDKNIAQMQLVTAQACVTALNNAKSAEASKDYDKAIAEYQKILDVNPGDSRVKALQEGVRKAKREANPTLSVSKSSMSFTSSGGTDMITVNCSMTWTISNQSSQFCTISRNGNGITVTCTSNTSTSSRDMYFTVKTTNGVKEQRVSITQAGSTPTYTLSASPTNITASSSSGTKTIYVTTNASSYEVDFLPAWCTVTSKSKTSFVLSYSANTSTSSRSDWFRVKAGGQTVRIDIKQDGKASSSSSSYRRSTPSISYSHDKLFSIGIDASFDLFFNESAAFGSYYGSGMQYGYGAGVRVRLGRTDQFFNLISGARYVGGKHHSGAMIPILLNMNLLRMDGLAFYVGGGYEIGIGNAYKNDFVAQLGMRGYHADLQFYYKPTAQVLGIGFTYYF